MPTKTIRRTEGLTQMARLAGTSLLVSAFSPSKESLEGLHINVPYGPRFFIDQSNSLRIQSESKSFILSERETLLRGDSDSIDGIELFLFKNNREILRVDTTSLIVLRKFFEGSFTLEVAKPEVNQPVPGKAYPSDPADPRKPLHPYDFQEPSEESAQTKPSGTLSHFKAPYSNPSKDEIELMLLSLKSVGLGIHSKESQMGQDEAIQFLREKGLVVFEDPTDMQYQMVDLLKKEGYRIHTASEWREHRQEQTHEVNREAAIASDAGFRKGLTSNYGSFEAFNAGYELGKSHGQEAESARGLYRPAEREDREGKETLDKVVFDAGSVSQTRRESRATSEWSRLFGSSNGTGNELGLAANGEATPERNENEKGDAPEADSSREV